MGRLLIIAISIISIVSIYFLLKREKENPNGIYLNYHAYLLIFGLGYFALPSLITLSQNFSPVGASEETIIYTAQVGLFFLFTFLVAFLLSSKKEYPIHNLSSRGQNQVQIAATWLARIISLYILTLLIINFNTLANIYGLRRQQANFDQYMLQNFKVYFVFNLHLILVSYLYLKTKLKKYFILLVPFILYSLVLSDRDFVLRVVIAIILLLRLSDIKINSKLILISLVGLVIMGILRSYSFDDPRILMLAASEFLFTWSTTHLIVESNTVQEILPSLIYSLSKSSFPGTYELLFGDYTHYHKIITENNPLIAGLGGSIIAETLSFKNKIITICMPILISLYAACINRLSKFRGYFYKVTLILSITYVHSIVRFTFLEHAFYIVFIMLLFGSWLIIIDHKYNR